MPRSCTICSHESRDEIEDAFIAAEAPNACPDCLAWIKGLVRKGRDVREVRIRETKRLRDVGRVIQDARHAEWVASFPVRRSRASKAATKLRDVVVARDGGVCGLCGEVVSDEALSIDHIVPVARGGTDELDNLQVAHRLCNSRKGAGHA